jgi:hydrogenase maturation protease
VLLGDEGVGVHVVRRLGAEPLPDGVELLDGGTGGLHLLGPLQAADRVVMVDATIDGRPAGTVRRLEPRFSKDYPPTLTAHDIGLKDLLDALHLLGDPPPVTLLAVSIDDLGEMTTELGETLGERLPALVAAVRSELEGA